MAEDRGANMNNNNISEQSAAGQQYYKNHENSSPGNIKDICSQQKEYFAAGKTLPVSFRIKQLRLLRRAIKNNEEKLLASLQEDMGKSPHESYLSEIVLVLQEIDYAIKNLAKWSKPQKVKTPIPLIPARSYIYPEPYGVALIIGPWNYPFQLIFAPLVAAIAAGNCAVVKPSELTPLTKLTIKNIINEYFDQNFVAMVEGNREVTQKLLAQKFDYIFFTGSIKVGKVVMRAAAENLTPVTLELGGKSPCIIDKDANLQLAASKVIWGKFINAGQTCVAPDYLYVHHEIKPQFMEALKSKLLQFYGENPQKNPDYSRIINEKHFARLTEMLDNDKVIVGGHVEQSELYIAPTIMDQVTWQDPVMQDEIFGPILPVLEFSELDEAIDGIKSFSKPLALYLFTNNKGTKRRIWSEVSFGGGCVNNVLMHLLSPHLPFGGVGESGMGAYHGRAGFDTFTHYKSTLKSSPRFDFQSLSYPPYSEKMMAWIKRIIG